VTINATLKTSIRLANCMRSVTCGRTVIERTEQMFGPDITLTDLLLLNRGALENICSATRVSSPARTYAQRKLVNKLGTDAFDCVCIRFCDVRALVMDQLTSEVIATKIEPIDLTMMQHCIELSKQAAAQGEFPFASLVCRGEVIVSEAVNRVARDRDITQHAELLAISAAQKALGKTKLTNCTVYSNVEPCVMCAFPIREARVKRVVFSLRSPLMGGYSRWNVLGDDSISDIMPEAFGQPIEVIMGLLAEEAERVFLGWNPLIWAIIKRRGCFDAGPLEQRRLAPCKRSLLREMLSALHN
jgi:tRNA(adenine34) deaminase